MVLKTEKNAHNAICSSVLNDVEKESLIKPSKDMNYIYKNNYIAIATAIHYGMMSQNSVETEKKLFKM